MATKKKRPIRSKAEMLAQIRASFAARATVTYEERVEIAENAFTYIDEMMQKPDMQGFLNLVDIVNLLVYVIHSTDTRKKCRVRHKCPNALEWLYEHTDEGTRIAQTVNDCQAALQEVMARHERTGSWALDGHCLGLLETVFDWYQKIVSAMPRAVLLDCIHRMDKHTFKDTPEGKLCHIAFVELDQEYIKKESEWESLESLYASA